MNVKEILVDLTLFNSLINRAIYNQCEIVLFNESNPEKFEAELSDLASRHADTVTVYKTLDGRTLFASDLHFNPYNVKVIAGNGRNCDECGVVLDEDDFKSPGSWSYNCHHCGHDYNHGSREDDYESEYEATANTPSIRKIEYYRKPQKSELTSRDANKIKMTDEIAKLPVFDEMELFGEKYDNVTQDFIKEDVPQYFVMTTEDGLDILVDTQGANYVRYAILIDTDLSDEFAIDEAEAAAYSLKPMIEELESKGYTVLDEGSYEDMTLYVANSKEEFADDIFLALIFGNEELVDIVNSNFKEKYAGKYAEVEEIAKKHEKKDEAEAVRMESLAATKKLTKDEIKLATKVFVEYMGGGYKPEEGYDDYQKFSKTLKTHLPDLVKKYGKDDLDLMLDDLWYGSGKAEASMPIYKIVKQPLEASETSFAQQMVYEALEMSDDAQATKEEIEKKIHDKDLWGYYQKSNPGTLRRARENPELVSDGLKELIKDGYIEEVKEEATALHPEQKGGQEIKLRKIADKYIDEVAKHANTGIVQHAILDEAASDLNKEQIASIRKALVEVGNRNMGNDRIRKEGKEGVIAGSDIAEWASWITSDCMGLTADYLMDSIGDRNAKDTYSFAMAKLEDCLMDFYRNEMNKSNYEEVYRFWEDLIYGKKAFGASEESDFFTVYLMKEKTPEEIENMCKSVETAFDTECAIVDNSAFNVMKIGKLSGNETAMNDVAGLIGQSEVLEIA